MFVCFFGFFFFPGKILNDHFRGPVLGTADGADSQKEDIEMEGQQLRHFGGKTEA